MPGSRGRRRSWRARPATSRGCSTRGNPPRVEPPRLADGFGRASRPTARQRGFTPRVGSPGRGPVVLPAIRLEAGSTRRTKACQTGGRAGSPGLVPSAGHPRRDVPVPVKIPGHPTCWHRGRRDPGRRSLWVRQVEARAGRRTAVRAPYAGCRKRPSPDGRAAHGRLTWRRNSLSRRRRGCPRAGLLALRRRRGSGPGGRRRQSGRRRSRLGRRRSHGGGFRLPCTARSGADAEPARQEAGTLPGSDPRPGGGRRTSGFGFG